MKADFPPLLGRAIPLPAAELPLESPHSSEISSLIRITQQKTVESAHEYLRKQKQAAPSLISHRILPREKIPYPLRRLTAKTAELEYQILLRFLREEKRISNLKKTWGFLRENFQGFIRSLKKS